jgi:excisionase family DNA binding protein
LKRTAAPKDNRVSMQPQNDEGAPTAAEPVLTDKSALLVPIERLLLRPSEAAASLAISPRKLWSLTKDGTIPAIKLGAAIRYSPAALRRCVEQMEGSE